MVKILGGLGEDQGALLNLVYFCFKTEANKLVCPQFKLLGDCGICKSLLENRSEVVSSLLDKLGGHLLVNDISEVSDLGY